MATILVVDDEVSLRQMVARLLERLEPPVDVLQAGSGAGAIETARTLTVPLDLLITDVGMDPMPGPEVAAEIRRLHPAVKVIYVSGRPDDPRVAADRLAPGETFVAKPFRSAELLDTVRRVLGPRD